MVVLNCSRTLFRLLLVMACLVAVAGNLQAQQHGQTPKAGEKVYNPHTKSYFELRVDLPKPPDWQHAAKYARRQIFKNVRGRLAIVRDLETHSFLKANFEVLGETWIGLRYYCSFRKLVWVDGTEHPRKSFKMWAKKWYRGEVRCGKSRIQYMPVYYLPDVFGFKWRASGPRKYYVSYFVEYPTGSENPEDEKKNVKNPAGGKSVTTEKPEAAKSDVGKPTDTE